MLFIGIILLGVSLMMGCTKNTANPSNNNDITGTEKQEESNKEILEDKDKSEKKDLAIEKMEELLPYEYEDILTGAKFRYPDGFGNVQNNDVNRLLQRNNEEKSNDAKIMFAKYYTEGITKRDLELCDIDAIKTPKDILENYHYKIELTLSIIEKVDRTEVEYEEPQIVNGIEMHKFRGTIHSFVEVDDERKDFTYGIVGYSFFGKNRPIMLCAYDTSVNQNQMEELTEIIDAMALSFQDEPEELSQ